MPGPSLRSTARPILAASPDSDTAGLCSGGDRGAKDRGGMQLGPMMPVAPPHPDRRSDRRGRQPSMPGPSVAGCVTGRVRAARVQWSNGVQCRPARPGRDRTVAIPIVADAPFVGAEPEALRTSV